MAQPKRLHVGLFVIFMISLITFISFTTLNMRRREPDIYKKHLRVSPTNISEAQKFLKIARVSTSKYNKQNYTEKLNKTTRFVDYATHIFYYPWYKNVKSDGKYEHWNHELLPHWTDHTRQRRRQHSPPGDIGANFYPELGAYSSTDPSVIKTHMDQISKAGVGELP